VEFGHFVNLKTVALEGTSGMRQTKNRFWAAINGDDGIQLGGH